ncbi:MAG: class I SAM-dependent methyltransferase [Promethearchaeota archaeon]
MSDDYSFHVKRKRPEEIYKDVRDYFKGEELIRYAKSKSIMRIQEKITYRAIELIEPKKNWLFLDAGAGPGFSSIVLNELGYKVVALDIIPEFLYYYKFNEINPIIADMCNLPFRDNVFDGLISISALQWIYRNINDNSMRNKLKRLFKSLEKIFKPNSRLVFQFYPKNDIIMREIGKIITDNTSFKGNYLIDNPNNPVKRKIFLILSSNKNE